MTDADIYKTLSKYSLVNEVANATGLHRNTIKNVLLGRTDDSMYLDLIRLAAQNAIGMKEAEIQDKINSLQSKIAA